MKKIEISNGVIEIPSSIEDITLQDYMELMRVQNKKDSYKFEELYVIDFLKTLLKISDEEINNLSIEDFNKISETVNDFKLEDDSELVSNDEESIIINGDEYVFISPEKLKLKDIINIKTYQQQKGEIDSLPYILCFLLKKKGKDGVLYDICLTVVDVIVEYLLKQKLSLFFKKLNFFLNTKKTL